MDLIIQNEIILQKIFVIRGCKVMLDSDLAELYEVETKKLNQSVNRNIERFPYDFSFQLSEVEWLNLKSQFVTSSWGGRRKLPKVFAELGIAMLSSVLNSKKAIQVNIAIMRIFVSMRQTNEEIRDLKSLLLTIDQKVNGNSKSIELLFEYMDGVMQANDATVSNSQRKPIGFKSSN